MKSTSAYVLAGIFLAVCLALAVISLDPYGPANPGLPGIPALPGQPAPDGHAANVTRWMQEHGGLEVPVGEYLDITNPGYLDSRPREVREAYYRMKTRVPDFSNPDEGMQSGPTGAAIAVLGFREVPEDGWTADAGNPYGQCILNESMVAVSNELADREISAGTYFKTVCPEFYFGLPVSRQAALSNQSISVSEIPGRGNGSASVRPQSVPVTRMEDRV